jgi:hypothetical protein
VGVVGTAFGVAALLAPEGTRKRAAATLTTRLNVRKLRDSEVIGAETAPGQGADVKLRARNVKGSKIVGARSTGDAPDSDRDGP